MPSIGLLLHWKVGGGCLGCNHINASTNPRLATHLWMDESMTASLKSVRTMTWSPNSCQLWISFVVSLRIASLGHLKCLSLVNHQTYCWDVVSGRTRVIHHNNPYKEPIGAADLSPTPSAQSKGIIARQWGSVRHLIDTQNAGSTWLVCGLIALSLIVG